MLDGVGNIKFLTPANCQFKKTDNSFILVSVDGGEFIRAYLYRIFPHDMETEFISVMDEDKNELGVIRSLEQFGTEMSSVLEEDLSRRYFIPKILEITALDEKFGNSYWTLKTNVGERIITVHDTFKNIIRIGEDRAIVCDADGNRYEIVSLSGLDRKSARRIELFL